MNKLKTWPRFEQDEVLKVSEVLESGKVNYWTGEEGKLFEKEFSDYIGMSRGIAVANGTLALDLALYGLDISEGDEVIVTPRSFMASASCIAVRGATPVFVDVDLDSQNINADSIKPAITSKTKAIILVHLAGWPCDLEPILELAKENNIKIIEDCAQAHGAKYQNQNIGSFGDISVFSFCQDKIMSTGGEGGMVLTSDENLYKKMWAYKDHGKDLDLINHIDKTSAGYKWLHSSFGTNYRLTEMQSAIGRIQLQKLDNWVRIRRSNAEVFNRYFSQNSKLRTTIPSEDIYHSYYKYYVFIADDYIQEAVTKEKILKKCAEIQLPVMSGSCSELYLEKAFEKFNANWPQLKNAKKLSDSALMFKVDHSYNEDDIKDIALKFLEILNLVI